MPAGEFELIERYFTGRGAARADVRVPVGDDAAIVAPPAPGRELVFALDTIVAETHFPAGAPARAVGHRALAVNLSDLAAMGAEPAWALLGLTLPAADERWVAEFAAGLDAIARRHGIALVGGDTTRGALAATMMLAGTVPAGGALLRSGARPGDDVWVSGTPGDAGAGLAILQGRLAAQGEARERLLQRFLLPEPRVELGQRLRGIASACIDISDGLAGDLGKLCAASRVGAAIDAGELPLSAELVEVAPRDSAAAYALGAGDDYELVFTAPASHRGTIGALQATVACRRIGAIVAGGGVEVRGHALSRDGSHGFDQFG
ncbi:MAG: thiamine-phosphate kinase [Gammaproteobacteria bacterium]